MALGDWRPVARSARDADPIGINGKSREDQSIFFGPMASDPSTVAHYEDVHTTQMPGLFRCELCDIPSTTLHDHH